MKIGQFKLDHVVEKNNECIIYRGSHDDEKVMVIQLNRQPLLKVEQFRLHFQAELNLLFKYIPQPKIIPEDFPFEIREQEQFECDIIEFPLISEIHSSESHYYFILSNCQGGQIMNSQIDIPKAFLQIYTLYDCYYQEFKEKHLADRDFSILRLFRSGDKISLIDFGFASLQKQLPKKSWTIKLGELFNLLGKNDPRSKVKNVINTLLIGRIRWEQIKELLNVSFNFCDVNLSIQESEQNSKFSRSNSIYSKQQTITLTMVPQEIIVVDQTAYSKSTTNKTQIKQTYTPQIKQSRIISYGNEKQREHFQRIKQSLSPGFSNTNRQVCRLLPIEQASQLQSPQVRSVSRKSYHFQTHYRQPITKPLENNEFEYKNKATPRQVQENQVENKEQEIISQLVGNQPIPQPQQKRIVSITTNQSQYDQSSYTPTIIQRGFSNDDKSVSSNYQRPQSSQPREQNKEMKTLLRKSTRELQQPDQSKRRQNTQISASRTINYSEQIFDNVEFKQIRRPQSRRNSIRKASINSVENIELSNDNHTIQTDKEENQPQKLKLKTPRDTHQYSFQNSQKEIKKQQMPIMCQQNSLDFQSEQESPKLNQSSQNDPRQVTDELRQKTVTLNQYSKDNNEKIIVDKYLQNVKEVRDSFESNEQNTGNYLPSFCNNQKPEVKIREENQPLFKKKEQSPVQTNKEQQYYQVEQVDQYYQDNKQNTNKLPPKQPLRKCSEEQPNTHQITDESLQDKKQNNSKQQVIKLQKVEDTPKSAKKLNLNNIQMQKFDIEEIPDQTNEKELSRISNLYENQLKKYDVIGKMVGGNVKYFQALKNFWIVPLFLCFKRMVSFRKLYEDGIREKINLFDLDMKLVEKVEKINILLKKLASENIIVLQELSSLFNQCQKTALKFEPKELAKIQKFLNMDLNQDIKDIYFVYLYTQVYKTLQSLKAKASDPLKLKENLILQAGCLASLIISEMPFASDKKYFDLDEYNCVVEQFEQEKIEKYIVQKEEIVSQLKQRLNQKGIKI